MNWSDLALSQSSLLTLFVIGVIPSEIWRVLGLVLSRNIAEGSELFRWVACIATATLAAVVARLLVFPSGTLADISVPHRVLAIAVGLGVFYALRRSVMFGVLAGEAVLIGGKLLIG